MVRNTKRITWKFIINEFIFIFKDSILPHFIGIYRIVIVFRKLLPINGVLENLTKKLFFKL